MMKRTFRLLTCLAILICCNPSFAQTDSVSIKKLYSDSLFSILINQIPSGWKMLVNDSQIKFTRSDSVWILSKNESTKPAGKESKAERNERIMKNGKKGISEILIKYTPKWSDSKELSVKNCNKMLIGQINNLPSKYGISHLIDKDLSSRGNPVYIAKTDADKAILTNYELEKKLLESKIITLPSYHSNLYSFFILSTCGRIDDNHYVSPTEASLELSKIIGLFYDMNVASKK